MKWTILLKRPREFFDEDDDVYVAHVEAIGITNAVAIARRQVFTSDRAAGVPVTKHKQYYFLLAMEGHCKPIAWAWETINEHLNEGVPGARWR